MFFDLFDKDIKEYFQRKMVEEKSYVPLTYFFGGKLSRQDYEKVAEKEIIEKGLDALPILREHTLTYLQTLLEKGEVKVGYYHGGDGIAEEYIGTSEEIIDQIRIAWNATQPGMLNNDPHVFESDVHIVLKENPWPVWR